MKHKTSRNRQREVECAAEHFLRSMGCVNTVRAVKTRFQRQDLFACDCVGKRTDGTLIGIQVTCGDAANVAHRRRKLERIAWSHRDRVLLGEYRMQRGKRTRHWFRMHELKNGEWTVWPEDVVFTSAWFKAYKPQGVADSHHDETTVQRSAV